MKAPQQNIKGRPDFVLLIMTIMFVGFGIVMVFSASSSISVVSSVYNYDALYFTKRQFAYAVLGLVAMLILMSFPYRFIQKNAKLYIIPSLLLLIIVPYVGVYINGATSWLIIGPLSLQPTEFAKLALILYLGMLITKKGEKFRNFKYGLLPVIIVVGVFSFFIMEQPDLGSCLILVSCAGIMIWAGGANLKQLFFVGVGSISVLAPIIAFSYWKNPISWDYRIARFTSYRDPLKYAQDESWQLVSSLQALGHGGFTGAGFGESVQKLHYLEYAYNDFIFAIIAEELGFIGATLLILFYVVFIWRGFLISVRCPDPYGMVVGVGIIGLIAVQTFVNIGGVTGFIPLTGVTLPFISFGGSSLLVTLMGMGVLLSISREYTKSIDQETTRTISTRTQKTTVNPY